MYVAHCRSIPRGGIRGSFPAYGGYGTYQFLNWAAKFFVDALLAERKLS
jgi:hypothetical protein